MIYKLKPSEFMNVRVLLEPLDYNLCLLSLLAGKTGGDIYVDHPTDPAVAFVDIGHHLFLAGTEKNEDFNQGIRTLLHQVLIPRARASGKDFFLLHFEVETWKGPARLILEGLYPLIRTSQFFECSRLTEDWRELIQPGYDLRPVSAELVAQTQLKHMDYLRDELCSERSSIEDFLDKSFGFVILYGDELVAWCLSEYNVTGRCEVGVATVDEYQKRGLGTITSLALVEHALNQGYTKVGWHCWKWNTPSSALARRAGFEYIRDYPVFTCALNLSVQFAFHGYDSQIAGDFQSAFTWYQKAFSADGKAPAWAYYNAARCLARLGKPEPALDFLRQALEHGFDDIDAARHEPDLESLRSAPGWVTIFPEL